MSDAALTSEDEDDVLAAEYALGVGEADALAQAHARAGHDARFAQRVAGWQERFVAMTDAIDPVTPPKKLRKTILKHLFPKARVPLMQRLWVWQGISIAALGLAAYLAAPLLRPAPEVPRDVFAAHMSDETDTLQVLAVLDTDGGIAMRRLAGGAPEGRVLEVWAILPDQAPVSLGVWPTGHDAARMTLPAALEGQVTDLTLAITDEPPGGGPGGAPSGSVRAAGPVSEL